MNAKFYYLMIGSVIISLIFYALQAVGLQTMAKRRGIEDSGFAWIPILQNWVLCKLSGPNRLFGRFEVENMFWPVMGISILTGLLPDPESGLGLGLLVILMVINIYIVFIIIRDLFRRYTNHPVLVACLSMFAPIFSIMVFVFRKRTPIGWNDGDEEYEDVI